MNRLGRPGSPCAAMRLSITVLAAIVAGCDGFLAGSPVGTVGRGRIAHASCIGRHGPFVVSAPSLKRPISQKSGLLHLRSSGWGGDLADEAAACALVVQKASELCLKLAEELTVSKESLGKDMKEEDTQKGISVIKDGDSSPVTAADFAIQGFVSAELKKSFPDDRFMGEEDASALREDDALCDMAFELSRRFGGPETRDEFLEAIDRGLEPRRGKGERVWILDPIDGTKGFMTGKNYIVGLALCTSRGEPVVASMGNPRLHPSPCVMVAVKGQGLKYWPAQGPGPVPFSLPPAEEAKLSWRDDEVLRDQGKSTGSSYPPWLVSRPMTKGSPMPFGPNCAPAEVCCGAMIKYWCVAQGTVAGFIQYETPLKSWDHACGVLCVIESGGSSTDAFGEQILFQDREFAVGKGIVCSAAGASDKTKQALLDVVAAS